MENFTNHIWRFVAAGLLLLFLVVFCFFLLPYASIVYEKFTLSNEQQEQISYMGNWQDRLAMLKERQEELHAGMDSMVINLAEEEEFSKVVEKLFDHSQSSGIIIKRIQPISESERQEYVTRQIRLDLEGGYHNIAEFINKLEQGRFLIVTKSIELSRQDGSKDLLSASLVLEITLFKNDSE